MEVIKVSFADRIDTIVCAYTYDKDKDQRSPVRRQAGGSGLSPKNFPFYSCLLRFYSRYGGLIMH